MLFRSVHISGKRRYVLLFFQPDSMSRSLDRALARQHGRVAYRVVWGKNGFSREISPVIVVFSLEGVIWPVKNTMGKYSV